MRIIAYTNLVLIALISLTGVLIATALSNKSSLSEEKRVKPSEMPLPKSPFPQNEISFEQGPLALTWVSPKATLPDLHLELSYLGKNHRPDVAEGKSRFYICVGQKKEAVSAISGEKLYLKYLQSGSCVASDGNTQTPLWLEMHPMTADATGAEYLEVKAYLSDEEHHLITIPAAHHNFTLKMEEKKGPIGSQGNLWDIGGARVDGSLLIRQGARLTGKDLFLEMHGGELFKDVITRERLDFLAGGNPYYCFIKEGDFLIWKDKKWQRPSAEDKTEEFPLLAIKKLDDKATSIELWDIEGKNKLPLSLPRSKNYDPPIDLNQEFKLVGAKTWVECVVECRGKRFLLKEGDWMVLTSDGWHKISSEKEVDDYVDQKINGPLFILDKITKKNHRTILIGHLFSALRTTVIDVELANQDNILKAELE